MRLDTLNLGSVHDLSRGTHLAAEQLRAAVIRRTDELNAGTAADRPVFILQHNSAQTFIDLLATWELGSCAIALDPKGPNLEKLQQQILELQFPKEARLGLITSGTTAAPRLIVHSEQALRAKMNGLINAIPISDIERSFCALPTFFGHGLVCNSLFPLLSGQTLYIADSFSPYAVGELDRWIEKFDITFLSTTPATWSLIEGFANPLKKPSLRRIHCASAPMTAARLQQIKNWCPTARVWNVYGLTEFLGWVSGHEIQSEADAQWIGRGWNVQMDLNPQNDEIQLRGSSALSFWCDLNDHPVWREPDTYWSTRDRGQRESNGEFRWLGRMDFLINKGGLKIQPEEVEAAAAEVRGINAVACVASEDDLWGQKITLFVTTRHQSDFSESKLREHLAQRLSAYKIPDAIRWIEDIPITNRGKVDRRALLDLGRVPF